jgi:RimJ/RimL family protein N-acetyltransferase
METPRTIDCGVCTLRCWQRGDRDALVRHANNRNVWRNLRDAFPHPYTESDADEWISFCESCAPESVVFAIAVDGEAAGTIGTQRQKDIERHSVEVGYWLGESCWGRGIMTAALRAVTHHALAQPDIYRVFATVFPWNPASMRVLEKAGYRREGVLVRSAIKDGVLIDRVLYAITRQPSIPYTPIR